ncbi:MAG: hypothetical protein AAF985_00915 [Bacteroidota bacterium]
MVRKATVFLFLIFSLGEVCFSQNSYDLVYQIYEDALEGNLEISFKEAVFHCKNAHFEMTISIDSIESLQVYLNGVLFRANDHAPMLREPYLCTF